jgi:hypothetical protein
MFKPPELKCGYAAHATHLYGLNRKRGSACRWRLQNLPVNRKKYLLLITGSPIIETKKAESKMILPF